jgi:hypothetical protein
MSGILGGQSMPPSILGGYGMVQSQPLPISASPFAMPSGPPAYGSDQWALATGGPGAMLMRELMRGFSQYGLGALAPSMAGKVFSDEYRALLAPEYQKKSGK